MLPKKPNAYFLQKIIFLLFYYQINMIYTADLDTTLTNIIKYSLNDLASTYVAIITTEKGNLFCSASYYQTSTLKYYYGLKPNGRPYFIKNNKETPFISTDSDKGRNEGNIFDIHLSSSSDDKEYIIAIGNNQANAEVYDFSNETPIIYIKNGNQFLGSEYNSFKYSTMIKLKNGDNIYLLSVILQQNEGGSYKFFNLIKFSFTSPDISNYDPIIGRFKYKSASFSFTSCFETDSNYIICLCVSEYGQYVIAAFDYNLGSIINLKFIYDGMNSETVFNKCIHFTVNTGVFVYFNTGGKICFDFIKFESTSFSNHFSNSNLNPFRIDNSAYIYKIEVNKTDLIKIADKKFCYITVSNNDQELHFFIFNNIIDDKMIIRHYTLKAFEKNQLKFGQELKATIYNDYYAIATIAYINSPLNYAYLILFSYPNSIDFILNITETLKNGSYPIINFNDKCKIENNIFGYEPVGIKLLEYSNGLKLLNERNKSIIIEKESIFSDNVELAFENNIDFSSNLRIEYAMVVKDAPFESYKDYSEIVNSELFTGYNEENYYEVKNYIGRTSYCDIILDSDQISKDCEENCNICDKTNKECFICKDTYYKRSDEPKKCSENLNILTTIPTNPTTIPIIIPSTFALIPSTPIIYPPTTSPIDNPPTTNSLINPHTTISMINPSTTLNVTKSQTNNINKFIPSTIIKEVEKTVIEKIIEEENDHKGNCTVEEIVKNKCGEGQIALEQIEEIKNLLLSQDYNGENTIIETETVIIQLSTLEDQMAQDNSNVSNIDLGECADRLKEENHIGDDEDLIIYKTDIKTTDSSSTYVTYEVYDSSLNKLDLSICSDVQISINVPVHLDDSLDHLAKSLTDSGYNIFDENDTFYNDICSTYTSENGTDILLSDRKKDIYSTTQNATLCQTGCELESYNSTSKKAKCNCDVTSNNDITTLKVDNLFNKKEIAKSFYDTLANSNFLVMKCYKKILDFKLIFKNYGEIIMTTLILIFLVMMIIYFILGTKKVHSYLVSILKWNSQNGKKNNFDKESAVESENKKISEVFNKQNKVNKQSNQTKKIRFTNLNIPPKKRKLESEIGNYPTSKNKNKKLKNSKFLPTASDIKDINQTNSENINYKNKIRNKKYKKKVKEEMILDSNKGADTKKNIKEIEDLKRKEYNKDNFNKIKIENMTENELEDLDYELAIKYDKRTFLQYYWSVLKCNQLLLFTFFPTKDYNSIYAKIALFISSFGLFFTINGFFFSDDTMHKVYEDNGEFDILYQIPQIFYSSVISSIANILLKNLSLSEKNILELKSEIYYSISKAKKKARKIERCLKIKLILFFVISSILMLFFWYFISCFCAVYTNTQIILIKDTGISFGTSMLYPFILSFIPGIFRIPALRAKNKNLKSLYKLSSFVNLLI